MAPNIRDHPTDLVDEDPEYEGRGHKSPLICRQLASTPVLIKSKGVPTRDKHVGTGGESHAEI